jgi:ATP/maltotriose-dependent transcriptional regulator MalT
MPIKLAATLDDIFIQVEARLIGARLLISEGLSARAVQSLADPPKRFPYGGERGEYLATLGLAHACGGLRAEALDHALQAEALAETSEVRSLNACIRAIVALESQAHDAQEQAAQAFQGVTDCGGIDGFVTAYRGYPPLLSALSRREELRDMLREITGQANDWALAAASHLSETARPQMVGGPLTRREREVLGLVAQGLTNKEIGQVLFISEATAKVHVLHIFAKLDVHTRTEAALRAADLLDD